jgi:hypothetical protein
MVADRTSGDVVDSRLGKSTYTFDPVFHRLQAFQIKTPWRVKSFGNRHREKVFALLWAELLSSKGAAPVD